MREWCMMAMMMTHTYGWESEWEQKRDLTQCWKRLTEAKKKMREFILRSDVASCNPSALRIRQDRWYASAACDSRRLSRIASDGGSYYGGHETKWAWEEWSSSRKCQMCTILRITKPVVYRQKHAFSRKVSGAESREAHELEEQSLLFQMPFQYPEVTY